MDEISKCILISQVKTNILHQFGEVCSVYLDEIESSRLSIEVHFTDCNYYELQFMDHTKTSLVKARLIEYISKERAMDKKFPYINRNNIRYFDRKFIEIE